MWVLIGFNWLRVASSDQMCNCQLFKKDPIGHGVNVRRRLLVQSRGCLTQTSKCVHDCDTFFSASQPRQFGEEFHIFMMMFHTRLSLLVADLGSELTRKIAGEDSITISHHRIFISDAYLIIYPFILVCLTTLWKLVLLSALNNKISNEPEI
jgi:hypothetical protein